MTTFKTRLAWVRTHAVWLAIAALPIVIAACTNGSGSGTGY
jgi:hypothetical protein